MGTDAAEGKAPITGVLMLEGAGASGCSTGTDTGTGTGVDTGDGRGATTGTLDSAGIDDTGTGVDTGNGRGATTGALDSARIDETCCPLFTITLTVCRVGMFLLSRFCIAFYGISMDHDRGNK
jgi:hypothetical protein